MIKPRTPPSSIKSDEDIIKSSKIIKFKDKPTKEEESDSIESTKNTKNRIPFLVNHDNIKHSRKLII